MSCAVCGSQSISLHGHHLIPQAYDGRDGPIVDLCGDCHTLIHAAALRMGRGRPHDEFLAHLSEQARHRAMSLIRIIVAANHVAGPNQKPTLSVELSIPMMQALDRFKVDRGFTSREQAVRAMMHELAVHYGTLEPATPKTDNPPRITSLRRFRGDGVV